MGSPKRQKTTQGIKPAYNAQIAVDAKNQIILAQRVVTSAGDTDLLPEMVDRVSKQCGTAPQASLADGGYFSQETALELAEKTQVYMPAPQTGVERFAWHPEENAYRCPQGYWLRPGRERDGKQIYRTRRCQGCAQAEACGVSGPAKEIHILVSAREAMTALRERMKTETGAAVYAKRKHIVEPVFGFFKYNKHFDRFLLRGQKRAGCEWSLLCIGHNLRRLVASAVTPAPAGASVVSRRAENASRKGFFGCFWFYRHLPNGFLSLWASHAISGLKSGFCQAGPVAKN